MHACTPTPLPLPNPPPLAISFLWLRTDPDCHGSAIYIVMRLNRDVLILPFLFTCSPHPLPSPLTLSRKKFRKAEEEEEEESKKRKVDGSRFAWIASFSAVKRLLGSPDAEIAVLFTENPVFAWPSSQG